MRLFVLLLVGCVRSAEPLPPLPLPPSPDISYCSQPHIETIEERLALCGPRQLDLDAGHVP